MSELNDSEQQLLAQAEAILDSLELPASPGEGASEDEIKAAASIWMAVQYFRLVREQLARIDSEARLKMLRSAVRDLTQMRKLDREEERLAIQREKLAVEKERRDLERRRLAGQSSGHFKKWAPGMAVAMKGLN